MPTLLEMALARIGTRDDNGQTDDAQAKTTRQSSKAVEREAAADRPALDEPAGWRERLQVHQGRRRNLGYDVTTANALAAGEVLNEYHFALTATDPPDPTICAGCGESLAGPSLDLGHGARVHDRDGHRCLITYGRKWRKQAADRLARLGIEVPAGLTEIQ